jgi:hypothetical protein
MPGLNYFNTSMPKKHFLVCLLFLFAVAMASAQPMPNRNKLRLNTISNLGLLNGSDGASVSLQAILGASMQNTFAGIGAGLDYYRFRTVPVFVDIRQHFGRSNRNIFVYGDLGYNYDWTTEKDREKNNVFNPFNFKGGLYYDAGLGYKVGFAEKDAFLLSLGYTVKNVRNDVGRSICPLIGPCYDDLNRIDYKLPRVVIKVGWKF